MLISVTSWTSKVLVQKVSTKKLTVLKFQIASNEEEKKEYEESMHKISERRGEIEVICSKASLFPWVVIG